MCMYIMYYLFNTAFFSIQNPQLMTFISYTRYYYPITTNS